VIREEFSKFVSGVLIVVPDRILVLSWLYEERRYEKAEELQLSEVASAQLRKHGVTRWVAIRTHAGRAYSTTFTGTLGATNNGARTSNLATILESQLAKRDQAAH